MPLLSPQRQRIRSRSAVLQNAPRGDVVLVRSHAEVSRENVRSECGGKGGFRCAHERPGYMRHPTLFISLSLAPPFSSPSLPLSGRWCGKSVVLTGTRWSTTLKAVVAVKEEGCRLVERGGWLWRMGYGGIRWEGGGVV